MQPECCLVTGGNPDDDVLMSQFIEFVIFFDWMITIGHCTATLTGLKSQLIFFFFSYSRYRLRRGNEKERKDGKRGKKKETKRKKKERKDNSNEKKRGK